MLEVRDMRNVQSILTEASTTMVYCRMWEPYSVNSVVHRASSPSFSKLTSLATINEPEKKKKIGVK